jgi:hypothetical protein
MINYQFCDIFEITNANDSLIYLFFLQKIGTKGSLILKLKKPKIVGFFKNEIITQHYKKPYLAYYCELWVGGW